MQSANGGASKRQWVSLVRYGLNQQHPNAYGDILRAMWESRDNLGYAWRILRDACCDGYVLIPKGRLDPTGMPDYSVTVEVIGTACLAGRSNL
jgi:hypothetical protein